MRSSLTPAASKLFTCNAALTSQVCVLRNFFRSKNSRLAPRLPTSSYVSSDSNTNSKTSSDQDRAETFGRELTTLGLCGFGREQRSLPANPGKARSHRSASTRNPLSITPPPFDPHPARAPAIAWFHRTGSIVRGAVDIARQSRAVDVHSHEIILMRSSG